MKDNVDIDINLLYETYQKMLLAEKVINENNSTVFSFDELELPDKKIHAVGFSYNENLISDEYVESMNKLKKYFGYECAGKVEEVKKHIYKLMEKFAEFDENAKAYFEQMQKQENNVDEAFGSDIENIDSNIDEYVDNSDVKAENHTTGNIDTQTATYDEYNASNISENHEALTDTYNDDPSYTNNSVTNTEAHSSTIDPSSQININVDAPVVNAETDSNAGNLLFTDPAAGSIFDVPV